MLGACRVWRRINQLSLCSPPFAELRGIAVARPSQQAPPQETEEQPPDGQRSCGTAPGGPGVGGRARWGRSQTPPQRAAAHS